MSSGDLSDTWHVCLDSDSRRRLQLPYTTAMDMSLEEQVAHLTLQGTTEPAQCQIHIPACHTLSTCPHKAPESHNTHPILQPAGRSQLFQSPIHPLHEPTRS